MNLRLFPFPSFSVPARLPRVLLALGVMAALGLVTAASRPAPARPPSPPGERVAHVFTVTHGAVTTLLVTPGSTGHQLGDLRVLPATGLRDEAGVLVGRLDASLLTTSVDFPAAGDEVRMSQLNFVFGPGDGQFAGSADQLVVSGSGFYPGAGSTIATGSALVRPVTGGSGRYAGATGSARTEHLADNTWRHTFTLWLPPNL